MEQEKLSEKCLYKAMSIQKNSVKKKTINDDIENKRLIWQSEMREIIHVPPLPTPNKRKKWQLFSTKQHIFSKQYSKNQLQPFKINKIVQTTPHTVLIEVNDRGLIKLWQCLLYQFS